VAALTNLLKNHTILIHQPVNTTREARFRSCCHEGGEMIPSPHFITPNKFIRCAALDHDRHSRGKRHS